MQPHQVQFQLADAPLAAEFLVVAFRAFLILRAVGSPVSTFLSTYA